MKLQHLLIISSFAFLSAFSCKKDKTDDPQPQDSTEVNDSLTIFFMNDMHGEIKNFAKAKYIIDKEREKSKVLVVCAGDIFSGNPVVDQYDPKGLPMVDMLNEIGVDVAVLGNHEFDYGIETLKDRMAQAQFSWICANMDVQQSVLPQTEPYAIKTLEDLKIAVLGVVETNGKPGDTIPLTHPWRVTDLKFTPFENELPKYETLKEDEGADLYMLLTHLGSSVDTKIANEHKEFDLIVGGHSHEKIDKKIGGTPVVQAGANFSLLGKLNLVIMDGEILSSSTTFIELDKEDNIDQELQNKIDDFMAGVNLDSVVGYSQNNMPKSAMGCFYTDALMTYLGTDMALQNTGGVRSVFDAGDITTGEVFDMDPFGNKCVTFKMSVKELENFFVQSNQGFYVSGLTFGTDNTGFALIDMNGQPMPETDSIKIGVNDYIPAVFDNFFPYERANLQELTTAEAIVNYLETTEAPIDYNGCNNYQSY
ncbi:bifunctional metallophosphatase/5'-nucleotidase [Fulvivirga ligni]|uniref:bifunctional metallophosphatase/5'-nucleotidase n=1 Tax=Fulvivirga ligni TaxID=2904246 RepID=UPI001F1A92DD|nr:bifunctional UDP-sugar hydrolase/5'-nucleotidase [Fulvivirga ligni]UII23425.1 bifunctional metallophosphatase/5'-nucleotidase [Fulvivirga ligni]